MDSHQHHKELINGISEEYREVLSNSKQSIYIYLDDTHKVCNNKFASLLGYSSPEEWSGIDDPFIEMWVEESSRKTLADAYQKAMESMAASSIKVQWKTKLNKSVETNVILVPISYKEHIFALHFIQNVSSVI